MDLLVVKKSDAAQVIKNEIGQGMRLWVRLLENG